MANQGKQEQIIPQLIPIEKNNETRKNTVLTNVIKMLTARGLLDLSKQDKNIKYYTEMHSDELLYKIELDNPEPYYAKDNKIMIVKLTHLKISSMSKSSSVNEIINSYKNNPKIIIVTAISDKLRYQIQFDQENYPNTEVFPEKELMINLIEHVTQPEFTLLQESDGAAIRKTYSATKTHMPKILLSDPISYYYNAKINQVFRIIRPSEISGLVPTYRLVVKGLIKE